MAFLLSRGTAVAWLRANRQGDKTKERLGVPHHALEASRTRLKHHVSCFEGLPRPLHLTTWNREDRRRTAVTVCNSMSLPTGIYPSYLVERGVFCAAPELVFLQMANVLDDERLRFLGFELCGRYGIVGGKSHLCDQICTPGIISLFLDDCTGVHGRKKAARVVRGVLGGAASPMEAALAICLVSPREVGGFGLPEPELNCSLPVKGSARKLWGTDSITSDLLWESVKLAIEYDSDEEHTAENRITRDSVRRIVLEELGYRVLSVTNGMFSDPIQLERIAVVVASALGLELPEAVDEEWVRQASFQRRIRDLAMHPERLLG